MLKPLGILINAPMAGEGGASFAGGKLEPIVFGEAVGFFLDTASERISRLVPPRRARQ